MAASMGWVGSSSLETVPKLSVSECPAVKAVTILRMLSSDQRVPPPRRRQQGRGQEEREQKEQRVGARRDVPRAEPHHAHETGPPASAGAVDDERRDAAVDRAHADAADLGGFSAMTPPAQSCRTDTSAVCVTTWWMMASYARVKLRASAPAGSVKLRWATGS